jgi:hypothetical protein
LLELLEWRKTEKGSRILEQWSKVAGELEGARAEIAGLREKLKEAELAKEQLLTDMSQALGLMEEDRESTVSKRAVQRLPQLTETLLVKWEKVQIDDLVSELEGVRTANYQLEAKIAQLQSKVKQLEDVSGSTFFCVSGPAVQGKNVLASSLPCEGVLASSVLVAPLGWSPRSFPPSSLAAAAAAAACSLFWRDSQSCHLHFHAFAPLCHLRRLAPPTAHESASWPTPLPDAASTRASPAALQAAKENCCCLPLQPRILSCSL